MVVSHFFPSTLKILFYYTLTSIVTSEKSVVSLIMDLLFVFLFLVISLFFQMFRKMFSLSAILQFHYKVYRHTFHFIYTALYSCVFFMYRFMSFTNFGKFLIIIFLTIVSLPFSVSITSITYEYVLCLLLIIVSLMFLDHSFIHSFLLLSCLC